MGSGPKEAGSTGHRRPRRKEMDRVKGLDVRGNEGPKGEELRRDPALQKMQERAGSREGHGFGHQDIKP